MNLNKRYNLLSKIRRLIGIHKGGDDFDWEVYNLHYQQELLDAERECTTILRPGDYRMVDGKLKKMTDIRPLHTQSAMLYETVLLLDPASVLECGCGGGDHMHNLKTLNPSLKIRGLDRSSRQLDFLCRRHPDLSEQVFEANLAGNSISIPMTEKPDLVYTQAVIMHIKKGQTHRAALKNLFAIAGQTIVLLENWKSHHFLEDIKQLKHEGLPGWGNLYIHYRVCPVNKRPGAMVIAKKELDLPRLEDYGQLISTL